MAKTTRGRKTAHDFAAPPICVTSWGGIFVEGGVLFASFWSGPTPYTIAMGPANAVEIINDARAALDRGAIEQLLGV